MLSIYRLNIEDYSLTSRDWRIVTDHALLKFESKTIRNETLQFITQTRNPYLITEDALCVAFECDENADLQGALYAEITNQAIDTTAFLAQEGIVLQDEVDDQNVLFAAFAGSPIALQKTRGLQVIESDNGFCMGTFDSKIGGADHFEAPRICRR